MKTEIRIKRLNSLSAVMGVCLAVTMSTPSYAVGGADISAGAGMPPSAMPSLAMPSMIQPSPRPGVAPAAPVAPPVAAMPSSSPIMSAAAPSVGQVLPGSADDAAPTINAKKNDKNLSSLEDRVNDSAKTAVARLANSTTDLTLDDLNTAKVAVAKIDALIDIEKHLGDLEKAREERKKSSGANIPQIPVSALQPPPLSVASAPVPQPVLAQMPVSHHVSMGDDEEVRLPPPAKQKVEPIVNQVMGTAGHYMAVIDLSGGQIKTVQAGDKLGDGSVVTAISANNVTIQSKEKTVQLPVKGIDKVYGGSF